MRPRVRVLLSVLTLLGAVVVPSSAGAAPRHDRHLTIAATPNPVLAGDGVLIYGQLRGSDIAGQTIRLYHHLLGSGQGFTLIGTTTTNFAGFYEFAREEGVVYTNRDWFVRGPDGSHSRTAHERVVPLASINAGSDSADTNHLIDFTGAVVPDHAFRRVLLQQQVGAGDEWRTLTSTQLDASSHYTIAYRWRRPGTHDVRVLIRRDARNTGGSSDPVSVNIEQAQLPGFTINSSAPITPSGSSVTISGVLDQPGTSSPEQGAVVQLWGRRADSDRFVVLADTTTASDGSYQFNQPGLTTNMAYVVRTMRVARTKVRHTAILFQGVRDIVTMAPSSPASTVGGTVSFTGTITPDKAGHVIYLQRQGKDGDWHTVEVRSVRNDSTFTFSWEFGSPGTFNFRARITSDGDNVGDHSPPVTVTVALPPGSSLPPGS